MNSASHGIFSQECQVLVLPGKSLAEPCRTAVTEIWEADRYGAVQDLGS